MLTDPASEHAQPESESMSESDNELDDKALEQLELAETQVSERPDDYDAHAALVQLLSDLSLKERLEKAREAFAAQFPLTEQYWLAWVADLSEATATAEDAEHLLQTSERSTQDYLSVELWAQFLTCVSVVHPDVTAGTLEGLAHFRKLAQAAVKACGPHVTAGSVVYEAWRTFECERVDAAMEEAGGAEAAGESPAVKDALQQARDVWWQQLSAVLADGKQTLAAYEAWEAQLPETLQAALSDKVLQAYERAQSAVALRSAFEAGISEDLPANEDTLDAYMKYVKFERSQGASAAPRVRVLLERAIARFPVTVALWQALTQHVEFVERNRDYAEVTSVHARACRNCPSCGAIWASRMRALERLGAALNAGGGAAGVPWLEEQGAVYEQALTVGLQDLGDYLEVLDVRLTTLRRCCEASQVQEEAMTAEFKRATALIASYFPDHKNATLPLCEHWARADEQVGAQASQGFNAWQDALDACGGSAGWSQHEAFVLWCAAAKRLETARERLASLLARKKNILPPHDLLACAERYVWLERTYGGAEDEFRARLAMKTAQEAATRNAHNAAGGASGAAEGGKAGQKRKRHPAAGAEEPSSKKAQGDSDQAPAAERLEYSDQNTVFVKHLNEDVDEKDLKALFKNVKSVRLLRKAGGVSKGCAYVDFESNADVEAALRHDRELFHERHIFVARSKPPGKQQPAAAAAKPAKEIKKTEQRQAKGGRHGSKNPGGGRGRGQGRGRGRGRGRAGTGFDAQEDKQAEHPHARLGADVVASNAPSSTSSKPAAPEKSNDDFRKFLQL